MDTAHLARLREEQDKAIVETDERITQWEEMKSSYVSLQDKLNSLSHQVSHDVMVPFGPCAFMPGKIVHTNEILVLLGDNWFVERSSKQAAEIAGRRIDSIEKSIKDLNEQRKLLQPRVDITSEFQHLAEEKNGIKEIVEDYDSDEDKKWKEKHKESVQAYRRKLQQERKQSEFKSEMKSELTRDELWARLDELEQIENSRQELKRLKPEQPFVHSQPDFKDVFPSQTTKPTSKTHEKSISKSPEKAVDTVLQKLNKDNKLPPSKHIQWEDKDSDDSYDEDSSDDTSTSNQTDSEPRPVKRITFSHSSQSLDNETSSSSNDIEEKSREGCVGRPPDIVSPADIYKHFGLLTQPKSILKKSSCKKQAVRKAREAEIEESRSKNTVKKMSDTAFSGAILEKPSTSVTQPVVSMPKPVNKSQSVQRPMSKFRAARQKQNESSNVLSGDQNQ